MSKDINNCLAKASNSFGRFFKPLPVLEYEDPGLPRCSHFYSTVLCSNLCSLPSAYQTALMFQPMMFADDTQHQEADYVINEDVLMRTNLHSIKCILLQLQPYWSGHVARMEDTRIPKVFCLVQSVRGSKIMATPEALQRPVQATALNHCHKPADLATACFRQECLAYLH